ncbi:MAG TPA: hypothetical protein VGI70_18305 [Polyangiales bacterium]
MTLASWTLPASSQAQGKPVASNYKGAVGLGLIGAELGAVIPAVAGVDATWAYIVFPVIGAAGGAVGGYFAIDHQDHAQLSVIALTAGMALIIPALVVTLSETAYDAESDTASNSRGGVASARHEPTRSERTLRARAAAGSGLLRLSEGEFALSAPGVAIVPSAQRGDTRLAGMSMSLLSGRF